MDAKPYLASTPWGALEAINQILCETAGYEFGQTSDGYLPARDLWEAHRVSRLTFLRAADLCLQCHRLAPFLFLNGNTFVSCARVSLQPALLGLPLIRQTAIRAALGHYIAGTIQRDSLESLL